MIVFRASEIAYAREAGDKLSALVLKSRLTLPVALPLQELTERIYAPDFRSGSSIDLTSVTGQAVADVQIPALADEFNAKAKKFTIRAILRELYTNKTTQYDFSEEDIISYELVNNNTRAKGNRAVTVHFNTAVTKGPFNDGQASIDMPHDEFMTILAETKKKGQGTLDLCSLFINNPYRYGFDPK